MKLKTVLIDDEKDSLEFIARIITDYCHELNIAGFASSALEGIKLIQKVQPDLVLLDVQMPSGNGFDILEALPERVFDVIFITAYDKFAIRAIKINAIDYILKPVSPSELIGAVKKVMEKRNLGTNLKGNFTVFKDNLEAEIPQKLAISTSFGLEYLTIKDIIRIEADGRYSEIHLTDGNKLVVAKNLIEFQELLEGNDFFRIHNSHIINLRYLKLFMRQSLKVKLSDGSVIPISKNKRDMFIEIMKKYSR